MVDQKQVANIFNDFLGLYLGKTQMGIRALCVKYEHHKMLLGLLSNMDEATKVPVPKVMKELYDWYKKYRGRELKDEDWQDAANEASAFYKRWEKNKWCNRVIIELLTLLETDEKERQKAVNNKEHKAA